MPETDDALEPATKIDLTSSVGAVFFGWATLIRALVGRGVFSADELREMREIISTAGKSNRVSALGAAEFDEVCLVLAQLIVAVERGTDPPPPQTPN